MRATPSKVHRAQPFKRKGGRVVVVVVVVIVLGAGMGHRVNLHVGLDEDCSGLDRPSLCIESLLFFPAGDIDAFLSIERSRARASCSLAIASFLFSFSLRRSSSSSLTWRCSDAHSAPFDSSLPCTSPSALFNFCTSSRAAFASSCACLTCLPCTFFSFIASTRSRHTAKLTRAFARAPDRAVLLIALTTALFCATKLFHP
mmetsp:Transcript_6039/g.14673  ORF Transcript_6039/g.14673 Transcript_6039/m.14673 type:complete len:201 (-) Transcript_6039:911-1513(-)